MNSLECAFWIGQQRRSVCAMTVAPVCAFITRASANGSSPES